ncbi:HAD family hydrolase [Agitococcus lubricus]|uniref:Phosphoglycolate phosphatase n=1 Tax=Agitococcus lubricus TaxID=1077255 RepID=A0A2T5J1R2_9GAMM|nr:HAD-IA family hydrolase [Agitococcus lubricus]PTQ90385.1 phosphoglycolate phosphatase [Agitococcus lubricus]
MSAYKLAIFDWDGTLMDSVAHIVDSMQQAAYAVGEPVPASAEVRHIIGLGLPEAIAQLFPHAKPHTHEAIRQQYAQHFLAHSASRSQLFAGAEALLAQLRQQGYLLAIATGKSRLGLNRVLAQTGIGHYFVATRCADETASKPDPQMLKELLAYTGVSVDQAVMIGDTSYDLGMAQTLSMPRIGVSYGVHGVEVLQTYQPLAIVDSLYQLHDYLW